MAAKKCAREGCGKTVYPIEELKCLDKVWHKQCFKCTVCGMTLTMKNYKGYDKLPYCEPHYPKTVASVVADTPEMRRIAENTKNQSSIAYHADYEKMKGTKIEIADDPETQRHLSNTKTQSQIAYTGEQDKKKHQEEIRPQKISAQPSGLGRIVPPSVPEPVDEDLAPRTSTNNDTPYSSRLNQQGGTVIYSSEHGGRVAPEQRPVGSIADYDPLNGKWGTVANSGSPGTADKLSNLGGPIEREFCLDISRNSTADKVSPDASLSPGRTSNGSSSARSASSLDGGPKSAGAPAKAGFAVKAIYDYSAADKDEVSFLEGDIIVNCEKVDEGWMTGTVQRTLQWGMLPANYVEPYKQPTGLHRIK